VKHSLWTVILNTFLVGSCFFNIKLSLIAIKYYKKYKIASTIPSRLEKNVSLQMHDFSEKKRLIMYGDSRIADWKQSPATENYYVINSGWGGATTLQLKAQLQNSVIKLSPDAVILQLGINDLTTIGIAEAYKDLIVENCLKNIEEILRELKRNNVKVFLIEVISPNSPNLFRRFFWNKEVQNAVLKVNVGLKKLKQEIDFNFIELTDKDEVFKENEKFYIDTLHFTPKAYMYLNKKIEDALKVTN
jgi:lysophospholipase L1-like esterase